ncbi:hypothetical protein CfE428DRAFT_2845 [Chthoniobacter flavus Ellin428]|uniref:Uncharacterized protein n=1 Tax=Chthoniobacter flavus Ellin428 TaxID=497964 RepID=B4D1Q7_9BACT|nr:hypothetical protein [Chthoniobacter flavus]EDY19669.1 hypothetical protein CfE428DRAFT_2845 [Chthoniobacter flavus Ellin428]TCO92905.1 hypothetical protein EV701_105182 [Chthoniobacter flavus]
MGLSEDWKKAKNRLEVMMSKRNPAEEFLGVFREGHSIETSLERADAAEAPVQLREALDEFRKEATAYTQILRTAAEDTGYVPPEDKPTYLANIESFENALAKLLAAGEEKAAALDGTDQVVKVEADPKIVAGQLMGMNKELIEVGVWVTKKLSTLTTNLERQKAMLAGQKGPKENMVRGFTMIRDAELKGREAVEAKARSFAELEKRVSHIPTELHQDAEVAPPLTQFTETAARVKMDLASVQVEQKAYIDFLNESIGMMA